MNLVIDLTPVEQAQLSQAAKQSGLALEEVVRRLVQQHLHLNTTNTMDDLDAKLRNWQAEDGVQLISDVSTQSLFAQWAQEDAQMTEEERAEEDRLWADLEGSLIANTSPFTLRQRG